MNEGLKLDNLYPALTPMQVVELLRGAGSRIYSLLFSLGLGSRCHAAIEICGVFNTFVDMLSEAAREGREVSHLNGHGGEGAALNMPLHRAKYLGEKLHCMFGPSLRAASPDIQIAFIKALLGVGDE